MIRGEAQANVRDILLVTFFARKLSNKEGFFSSSDPFLVISRMNEDGTYTQVWKNEKVDNSLNPSWAPARIPMMQICNGDIERPLRIEVFDFEKSGHHQSMGQVRPPHIMFNIIRSFLKLCLYKRTTAITVIHDYTIYCRWTPL